MVSHKVDKKAICIIKEFLSGSKKDPWGVSVQVIKHILRKMGVAENELKQVRSKLLSE